MLIPKRASIASLLCGLLLTACGGAQPGAGDSTAVASKAAAKTAHDKYLNLVITDNAQLDQALSGARACDTGDRPNCKIALVQITKTCQTFLSDLSTVGVPASLQAANSQLKQGLADLIANSQLPVDTDEQLQASQVQAARAIQGEIHPAVALIVAG